MFVLFAVVNRQFIEISFFPFPYSLEMPQFLFAILCFGLGAIAGSLGISLKLSHSKRLLKSEHRQVMALKNEIGAMHAEQHDTLPATLPKT